MHRPSGHLQSAGGESRVLPEDAFRWAKLSPGSLRCKACFKKLGQTALCLASASFLSVPSTGAVGHAGAMLFLPSASPPELALHLAADLAAGRAGRAGRRGAWPQAWPQGCLHAADGAGAVKPAATPRARAGEQTPLLPGAAGHGCGVRIFPGM